MLEWVMRVAGPYGGWLRCATAPEVRRSSLVCTAERS